MTPRMIFKSMQQTIQKILICYFALFLVSIFIPFLSDIVITSIKYSLIPLPILLLLTIFTPKLKPSISVLITLVISLISFYLIFEFSEPERFQQIGDTTVIINDSPSNGAAIRLDSYILPLVLVCISIKIFLSDLKCQIHKLS